MSVRPHRRQLLYAQTRPNVGRTGIHWHARTHKDSRAPALHSATRSGPAFHGNRTSAEAQPPKGIYNMAGTRASAGKSEAENTAHSNTRAARYCAQPADMPYKQGNIEAC